MTNNISKSRGLFFLLLFCLYFSGYGQRFKPKSPIENGVFVTLIDESQFKGVLLNDTILGKLDIKIITGDTIHVNPALIKRSLMPDQIFVYDGAKYHTKNGLVFNNRFGVSAFHGGFQMGLAYRFKEKYELGIGVGYAANGYSLQLPGAWVGSTVNSFPVFATGKYFFNNKSIRPYAIARLGLANNITSWGIDEVGNGFYGEAGLGLEFASKLPGKFFIELSQYTSYARGTGRSFDWNSPTPIEYDFSLWFNRIVFSFGYYIGK